MGVGCVQEEVESRMLLQSRAADAAALANLPRPHNHPTPPTRADGLHGADEGAHGGQAVGGEEPHVFGADEADALKGGGEGGKRGTKPQ